MGFNRNAMKKLYNAADLILFSDVNVHFYYSVVFSITVSLVYVEYNKCYIM